MISKVKIRVSYTLVISTSRIHGPNGFEAATSSIEQNTIEYTKEFDDADNDRDLVGLIIDDARSTMSRAIGWDIEIITSFQVAWDILA